MKVIVHGAKGRMGNIIAGLAETGYAGSELAAKVDFAYAEGEGLRTLGEFTADADVVVDFSSHLATKGLLDYCIARSLPVVIATTGQTPEEMEQIRAAAKLIPVFNSANMSVGIAVLAELAQRAAAAFPDADIEIIETHHNQKKDVPSGTALLLARSIQKVRTDATLLVGRHEDGKRPAGEIGIHSIRLGNEVGTHEILISTGTQTITLKHEAENRALFAEGALTAAAYIADREPGLYDMETMLG